MVLQAPPQRSVETPPAPIADPAARPPTSPADRVPARRPLRRRLRAPALATVVVQAILAWGDRMPSVDGTAYFAAGRNLLEGAGYTRHGAPELHFPPVAPVLFALGERLLGSEVAALRVLHLGSGLACVALLVALAGIFGSLTALGLERVRELSTLRALGMTRAQVGRLLTMQSGLLGLLAGLLALPTGVLLAAVMVLVINKRAFGWTLFFSLQPRLLVEAVLLSVAAALLAGLWPAHTMAVRSPAAGLREE